MLRLQQLLLLALFFHRHFWIIIFFYYYFCDCTYYSTVVLRIYDCVCVPWIVCNRKFSKYQVCLRPIQIRTMFFRFEARAFLSQAMQSTFSSSFYFQLIQDSRSITCSFICTYSLGMCLCVAHKSKLIDLHLHLGFHFHRVFFLVSSFYFECAITAAHGICFDCSCNRMTTILA